MTPALIGVLRRIATCTVLLAGSAVPVWAQGQQPTTQVVEKIEFIKTGLFMISGDGGNTVVRLSGNGMILVDGKLPGHYGALTSRAHAIADELPVRLVVLTGPDERHTGTNGDFVRAGVPVMAQEHAKEILGRRAREDDQTSLPSITFDEERTIRLGGVTVQVLHFGAARTNGDAVVYFPDLKVVAVGDLYTSAIPVADDSAGGSLECWGAALHKILRLEFDTVLPGSGPMLRRAELEALATRVDKLAAARAAANYPNFVANEAVRSPLAVEPARYYAADVPRGLQQ
jgi:glyoxylase-like metal-dependent hydrolase (beta-lactamase superfamily II)